MNRNFVVGLFGGLIGSAMLLIVLSAAGIVGAREANVSRSDVSRANDVSAAPTVTNVCGNITTNTTWSLITSPYDVCTSGVNIGPTATLTIQPGVTVQFDNSGSNKLNVNYGGALSAIGTLTQPITFTGVVATPGSWGGISAFSTITPSVINLSYVTLEYGGVNSSTGAQLYTYAANHVTVTHSLIRNGAGAGVHVGYLSQVDIHDTSFISNALNAIQLDQPSGDILMSGLSASGNGVNAVFIAGTTQMNGQRRWAFTGLPYVINAPVFNGPGDVLSIDPGNELQFTINGTLLIYGEFKAIGLPNAPITLTGQIKTPGAWIGLQVHAIAQLDYVTVEYGGSIGAGANIWVGLGGQLVARHSRIRYSSKDGVRNDGSNASLSILNSQIFSNTLYGVRNVFPTSAILAANNWWGDANGPKTDTPACSPGNGDKVTNGVLFRPVLTSTNLSAEFPLSDAPILTLTPRRWFAPADGTTKVYFDITLRDGNGAPLPGRTVYLHSTIGSPTDGGITGLNGKTLAYLRSGSTGDANVSATFVGATACEEAMSPRAKVTFTTPLNITDLFPNSPASYFDGDISVTPMPVIVGITATIHAKLTNPLTVPITVDVSFGFLQSSIGLAFGPIGDITATIPASSTITLAATFVPIVSGHYCVQVSYNITAIGSMQMLQPQEPDTRSRLLNLNALPAQMRSPRAEDSLDKADVAISLVSELAPDGTDIQMAIFGRWWSWAFGATRTSIRELGGDPPRQDYNQTTLPVWHTWPPVQPDASVSITRAAALNTTSAALADAIAYGTAATVALDRYAGASEANNLTWAAEQANARLYYQEKMGDALLVYAYALEDFVQVLTDEGETNITITVGDTISYQQRLTTTGFTVQEIADAHLVGLTDADIAELRQEIIAANPNDIAGNLLDKYTNVAAISRELGRALIATRPYEPGLSVSGRAGLRPSTAISNTLAQINNMVDTLQLGNPLTQTALIDIRARRIDLPADWMVNVSPAQVTLTPSETITVTVSVIPGSLVPQGSIPRVAVEGYVDVGNQLLGGVVFDIVVPKYVDFAPYHVYLPLIRK